MKVSFCFVKYGNEDMWSNFFEMFHNRVRIEDRSIDCDFEILIHDNSINNVGLVRARNELLTQARGDVMCFMDYDLELIEFHWKIMALMALENGVGIVFPYCHGMSSKHESWYNEWEDKEVMPCNCFFISRQLLNELGRFDNKFHTAYADWDLIQRVHQDYTCMMQHNRSFVIHLDQPKSKEKVKIWEMDHAHYLEKWQQDLDRSKL